MTHLINCLQFEFNCHDEDQAFNFRQNFATTFQEQIVDAADKICSQYVGEEEWIRLDKLEIDLGGFSPAAFDANFSSVFKSKFEKALVDKLSNIPSSQKKESFLASGTELLTYFLQKGSLPWWAHEQDVDINEIILSLIANESATITRFLYHHQTNKNLWKRIAFQLSQNAKTKLVASVGKLQIVKNLFVEWTDQFNILLKNENYAELNITDAIIEDIVLKNAPEIFQYTNEENIYLQIFKNSITAFTAQGKPGIDKIISAYELNFIKVFNKIANDAAKENNSEKPGIELEDTQAGDEEIVTEKYIVKQAGIILLSSFLKPFFTNLHLLNGQYWKNKDAQYKAVHLLQFLSTGEQKTFEYNLTLEKIMCGLHIEEPIPLDVVLEKHETDEAISLLESVIEHWRALKNTSVNGLRESFLRRDGLLTQKESGWLLQIERKTIDVLVDSIPWGYNTLTFSWSDNLIFVEW